MWQLIIFFIIGLIGLWIGAELIIKAAGKISKFFGLSEVFIGLTMLALGADFPEIMLSFTAAMEKRAGKEVDPIIVGNILGSTMCQIALILGLAGLLSILKMKKKITLHNGIMLLISSGLLFLVSLDGFISRADGLIFVIVYLVYFLTLQRQTMLSKVRKNFKIKSENPIYAILQLALGLFVIVESSQLVLTNSIAMAESFGVSQLLIGILLVGLGTSLPELVIAITAVIKGSDGLSIGNLMGCYIVDVLISLGASALLGGWTVDRKVVFFDMPYLIFTTVVVVLFLLTREKLERKESALIILLYLIYIVLKFNGW